MIRWAAVGGGRMAGALLRGSLAAGRLQPEQVAVAEPNREIRRQWEEAGCMTTASASELPAASAFLLCVKPQDLAAAAAQLADGRDLSGSLVVSIVAGVGSATLQETLAARTVVRAMPNTPAQIGAGCTFAYAADSAAGARQPVEQLFAAVGELFWVEDERLIDAATAVAGSGPAYAFSLIEAMAAAGVQLGLEPEAALAAAAQTVRGAASMVLQLRQDPAELRANVTSPGGTTEAALAVLDEKGFAGALQQAIESAHRRAGQLAREAGEEKKD